jgi:hypothetical protein
MALEVKGLGVADYQEIVEALLVAADHSGGQEIAERRRDLADRIGQALDTLPVPRHLLEAVGR